MQAAHFLGLRLNFFVAIVTSVGGLAWFIVAQRCCGGSEPAAAPPPVPDGAARRA